MRCQFSINWVRLLQDGKAWRWHSKSRSAGIESDGDTVGLSVWSMSACVAKGSSSTVQVPPAQLTIHASMFICFKPNNHRKYTAIFSVKLEASLHSHCYVKSGWHNIAVWVRPDIFLVFVFSFVIVLVFVRFSHWNFYIYIVFVSQIIRICFHTHRTKFSNSRFRYENRSALCINTSTSSSTVLQNWLRP